MKRWMAAIVAILTVILSSLGGMIAGAIVGNLIVPARLFDWTGTSDPGLLLVGAILGLLGGFYFGIWAAMGIVDDAAAKRDAASSGSGPLSRGDRPSRSDRSSSNQAGHR